jgi:ABC-type Na+ efflux pump permease subunit
LIAASILISGLAISLTAFAKTTKEAQSKTQVLSFLSIIPMFINMMNIDVSKYIYFIPIMNYSESLMNIFNNKIDFISILIVFLSSVVYIAIVIKMIISQYKEEKVLFAN